MSSGSSSSGGVKGDNGYLEILTSLGIPGGLCLAVGFFLLWRHLSICSRFGLADDYLGLARTFLIVLSIAMLAGNFFSGLSVMWIVFGRALSSMMLEKMLIIFDDTRSEAPAISTA